MNPVVIQYEDCEEHHRSTCDIAEIQHCRRKENEVEEVVERFCCQDDGTEGTEALESFPRHGALQGLELVKERT